MKLTPLNLESLLDRAYNFVDKISGYVLIFGILFFISIVVRLIFKF